MRAKAFVNSYGKGIVKPISPSYVPCRSVALVFEAGLKKDGMPYALIDRFRISTILYNDNVVKIVMVGDNSTKSNDGVNAMIGPSLFMVFLPMILCLIMPAFGLMIAVTGRGMFFGCIM